MAAMVVKLQLLQNDQSHLSQLVAEVDKVTADNALLHGKSLALPGLQAEHDRLKVGVWWVGIWGALQTGHGGQFCICAHVCPVCVCVGW